MRKILLTITAMLVLTGMANALDETIDVLAWGTSDGKVAAFDLEDGDAIEDSVEGTFEFLEKYAETYWSTVVNSTIEEASHGTVTLADVFLWAIPKNAIHVTLYKGYAYVSAYYENEKDGVAYSIPVTRSNLRKARLLLASMR